MQSCLGIYIENNLIKYAKVAKENDDFKVEAFGIKFFDNINTAIAKIVEETFSFNVPISINLAEGKYLYYDIFSLLSKSDIQKTVETEFEAYCDENKYNKNAFETRYALVPNAEDKEKLKAIQIAVNKIELNKQKQLLEKYKLSKIVPLGTSIASIAKLERNENAIIVNMEDITTITTIINNQVYNVEEIEEGSQEVLEKINKEENSIAKAYDICKQTTIYTSNVISTGEEQPHLQHIVPTLYKIAQKIQQLVSESTVKISTIYLTGSLSSINNVDLYFQEFLPSTDCKILRPNIIEENVAQLNIKEYIEVNSAIAIAMQGLGEGIQALNFKNTNVMQQIMQTLNKNVGVAESKDKKKKNKNNIEINFSLKGKLDLVETILVRCIIGVILIGIIYIVFTKMLYSQMKHKEDEILEATKIEKTEIQKVEADTSSLNQKNQSYNTLIQQLNEINNRISDIASFKNSIPNLLNQIMYVIPESVQLTTIRNTEDRKITITAKAEDYDQLGYFVAKLKVKEILLNVVSSSGQKNEGVVTITIEGELP